MSIKNGGAPVTAERLVVVGGGPAALEAVRAYREEGADGEVVLVSADEYLPYNRPPLSKDFLRGESEEDALPLEDGGFYRRHDIEVRLRTRAQALDTERRVVVLSDGETLSYGWCILATGASPKSLPVPGAEGPGVRYLRSRRQAGSCAVPPPRPARRWWSGPASSAVRLQRPWPAGAWPSRW